MNIKEIVTENLIYLRHKNKMTQQDLGKRINYSDKAVSRWENGEVTPDVETLYNIGEVYGVPVAYFFERHAEEEAEEVRDNSKTAHIIAAAISVCVVWLIAVIIYVYIKIFNKYAYWQVFVWGIPASALVMQLYNVKQMRIAAVTPACSSVATWGVLTGIYCTFLEYNLWLIFLIGVPIQTIIFLNYFFRRTRKKDRS